MRLHRKGEGDDMAAQADFVELIETTINDLTLRAKLGMESRHADHHNLPGCFG